MSKSSASFAWASFLGIAMMAVSIYLSVHYFAVKFPVGLSSGSICNINSFLSCDKTIDSAASSVAGVPISLFGFLIGLLVVGGIIFKSVPYRSSVLIILAFNFLGCLGLLIYSIFFLHGLCPFCAVYYVLSAIVFFLLYQRRESWRPDLKLLSLFGLCFIVVGVGGRAYAQFRKSEMDTQAGTPTATYLKLPQIPQAELDKLSSPYKLASGENAPIKIQIFSDFQCPGCGSLSKIFPELEARYQGKIDIQYFFFPLDIACNPEMQSQLHQFACQAASIAVCMPPSEFTRVHDELFVNQDHFSVAWLNEYASKNGVVDCVSKPETKLRVQSFIAAAGPIEINVTPTFLVNGRKFEGAISAEKLIPLLDELVRR